MEEEAPAPSSVSVASQLDTPACRASRGISIGTVWGAGRPPGCVAVASPDCWWLWVEVGAAPTDLSLFSTAAVACEAMTSARERSTNSSASDASGIVAKSDTCAEWQCTFAWSERVEGRGRGGRWGWGRKREGQCR